MMRMIICIALTMALARFAAAEIVEPSAQADLTQLPIEELMSIQVTTASKFPQKTMEAPSSVSIITAADIKNFGYRTLADIVRSVRGMAVSYDRNYDYFGIRGMGRTGDYNSRVLLLVDGFRINDPIYDTAPIGTEFPLDVDLIDRVEIVRGPGSSIYGSNAVLGVINVITKRAKNFNGTEASGELGSFGTDKERLSYGKQYENGAGLLLSATRFHSRGQDLFFPEFNAINNGVAQNLDSDRYKNFYGKLNFAGFTLTGAYVKRDKAVPTASFDALFNDPNFQVSDGESYVNLEYVGEVSQRWDVSAHLFQGRYSYDGIYPYAGAPVTLNYDQVRGAWWGSEVQFIGHLDKHKVVAGAEYQDNFRQDQSSYYVAPYALLLDDKRSSTRKGLYVQDEIALGDGLLLNAGLRHDQYSSVGAHLTRVSALSGILRILPRSSCSMVLLSEPPTSMSCTTLRPAAKRPIPISNRKKSPLTSSSSSNSSGKTCVSLPMLIAIRSMTTSTRLPIRRTTCWCSKIPGKWKRTVSNLKRNGCGTAARGCARAMPGRSAAMWKAGSNSSTRPGIGRNSMYPHPCRGMRCARAWSCNIPTDGRPWQAHLLPGICSPT